jgi:competence protein ComGC
MSILCLAGIGSILGLVFGIIAVRQVNGSRGRLKGGGLAVAGITLSTVSLVLLPLMLAIAIPNFVRARDISATKSCVANMKELQAATQQWAMDNRKNGTEKPDLSDIAGPGKYINEIPTCPSGGTYELGTVDGTPRCSIHGDLASSPW